MTLTELDTPTLILDEDRMQRNINRMAERIDALGIRLRPHVKTCKSIDVTKRVLGEEGDGITVSTLKEAEYFADAGYRDIFYAVSLAPGRVPRAAKLILRGVSLMSECHDLEAARMLEGACENVGIVMPLVVEVNVDGHRCGVPPEDDRLLHVARFIHASPHLEMRGIERDAGAV